ncbi:MAG: flagellar biosynthesis protein FliQ [Rickettsiales bacterium]|nr:flagellar biosynthesis protein FliQ [Rickettsiales bacterium]
MESSELIEICRQAIFVMLKVSLPLMLVALVVGLIISLIQALTQIQEMTLSFVPKIITIFLALILAMPFMINTLGDFTDDLFKRISEGSK